MELKEMINSNNRLNINKNALKEPMTSTTSSMVNRFSVKSLFKNEKKVTLNIGGARHEVLWKTLESIPASRLGRIRFAKSAREIEMLCDYLNLEESEIFFDKQNASFDCILNFYRTGKLHMFENMCVLAFHEDLIYWGIEDCYLENCCHLKYHQRKDALLDEIRKEEDASKENVSTEKFGSHCFPAVRKRVWDLMENPQTSKTARVCFFNIGYFFISIKSLPINRRLR